MGSWFGWRWTIVIHSTRLVCDVLEMAYPKIIVGLWDPLIRVLFCPPKNAPSLSSKLKKESAWQAGKVSLTSQQSSAAGQPWLCFGACDFACLLGLHGAGRGVFPWRNIDAIIKPSMRRKRPRKTAAPPARPNFRPPKLQASSCLPQVEFAFPSASAIVAHNCTAYFCLPSDSLIVCALTCPDCPGWLSHK